MEASAKRTTAGSRAATAEKHATETSDAATEDAAAKRTRTPVAAAAEEQAAGKTTALTQLKVILLGLPWRERAGYLDKTFAS